MVDVWGARERMVVLVCGLWSVCSKLGSHLVVEDQLMVVDLDTSQFSGLAE